MRYLIDVDGVLANFIDPLLEQIGGRLKASDIKGFDFFQFLTDGERIVAETVLADGDFWASLPVIAGAREGVNRLRVSTHDVFFVTAPWEGCRVWDSVRRGWLREHFDAGKKDVACLDAKEIVQGHVLIDDKASTIEAWARANHGRAYLYTQPWNVGSYHPFKTTWDVPNHL